jgi:hypothetical protein
MLSRLLRKPPHQQPQSRANLPSEPVEYPFGICVRTERGAYYLKTDGKRYRIPTQAIMDSWQFPFVVDASEAALANYPIALAKLIFREGSLLNNIADGRLYLVSGFKLRHVVDPAVLDRMGINHLMARVVSDAEIQMMKMGEPIK